MIVSWVDLVGTAVLFMVGLFYLRLGAARVRRSARRRWSGDLGALLTAVLGGAVVAMGLWLLVYSLAFAVLSEGILSR